MPVHTFGGISGILLVGLRDECLALKPSIPYVVTPLAIPNFSLMGKLVEEITVSG